MSLSSSGWLEVDSLFPVDHPRPTNDFTPFLPDTIEQGIHQRFEQMTLLYPNHPAIKTPLEEWSYAELNYQANRVAHLILAEESDSNQVGLLLPHGASMIGAMLGVLKASKIYVPLDPGFPTSRLTFMAKDAEIGLLITNDATEAIANDFELTGCRQLNLDQLAPTLTVANPDLPVDPKNPAYILYTSGSTGQPKGILFGHRNLLHTIMCLTNALHFGHNDRLTQFHSTSFAASVVDIYCSLLNGGTLYPWDVKRFGFTGLADWLISQEITSFQWIPTPFRHFVDSLAVDSLLGDTLSGYPLDKNELFSHLRLVVMASEPLTIQEVERFRHHFPATCLLVNQMGTSESYNYRLFFLDQITIQKENHPFEGHTVPAGYPVSSKREVLILNEAGKPVETGETGEIAIRSPYMSLGYWRRPELNQAKFRQIDNDLNTPIYLTGDLGYLQPDGCLIHLGRRDFQVKIRGYRVEVGEIERRLCEFSDISDAVVHMLQNQSGEQELIAYIVPTAKGVFQSDVWRTHLAQQLPDYMIPADFVELTTLPTTDTGKLDRNALPLPPNTGTKFDRPASSLPLAHQPQTETERRVAQIWQETLQVEPIGLHDNFFALGGHSLKQAQMLQQVQNSFGRSLPFAQFIQSPTIAALATWLEQDGERPPTGDTQVADTDTPIPDGLWQGIVNRVCQILALYAPGLKSLRVWLHRMRGVSIGENVAIGTAAIIETSYPRLVSIGNNSSLGIRTVIIGHFVDGLGATPIQEGTPVHAAREEEYQQKRGNKSVVIEDDVFIGPMVTILPQVTIGRGSVVAAGSVVNQSVPPQTMVQGNPAKPVARCPVPLNGKTTYEAFLAALEFPPEE